MKSLLLYSYILIGGLFLYTYVLYPLILWFLSLFIKKKITRKEDWFIPLTLIITAYNEEKNIEKKIENTLSLEYPQDKLQIIVASDASNDRTDQIVKKYEDKGVSLLRNEKREGKTAAQNKALKEAKGEVIVFSDATTIYEKESLKKLVRNFYDKKIGCVGGNLSYLLPQEKPLNLFSKIYWEYEKFIKRQESKTGLLFGLSGCMYAIRKELAEEISPDLMEDLARPLLSLSRGYINFFEEEAKSQELVNPEIKEELSMRTRIITRTLYTLLKLKNTFNPLKNLKLFFALLSHKLLRYLCFSMPSILFIMSILERGNLISSLITGGYILSLLSYLGVRYLEKKNKSINFPPLLLFYYVFLANLSVGRALFKLLKREKDILWQTSR